MKLAVLRDIMASLLFLQGERNYAHIKGQTGPLVYPAGFLYVYSCFFRITRGGNIATAQAVFAVMYVTSQFVTMQLYIKCRCMSPWTLVLLCLSKRVHSIFLLRMFNDGVTTLLTNIATLALVNQRWRLALLIFSGALSVKMNVLLLAPPVAIVLLQVSPRAADICHSCL